MSNDPWADRLVADDRRARAYEAAPAPWRARLKKLIAQLDVWFGRERAPWRESRRGYALGLDSRALERPADMVVATFTAAQPSPARLLAALWPALSAGTPEALAVCLGEEADFPDAALLALELAGVELALAAPPARWPALLADLGRRTPRGRLLELGPAASPSDALPPGWSRWRPTRRRADAELRLGVWLGDGGRESLDLDALAWAQAGARLEGWTDGPARSDSGLGRERVGPFERFLAESWDAALVPAARLEAAASAVPLTLGPGQEGSWLWPELRPSFFLERRVLWRDAAEEPPCEVSPRP